MVEYSVLELCANRAGYEAVPREKLDLALDEVEKRLASAGFEPLANAGVIVVLRWGTVELSIFESGKVLVKTRYEDRAREAFDAFRAAMGWVP